VASPAAAKERICETPGKWIRKIRQNENFVLLAAGKFGLMPGKLPIKGIPVGSAFLSHTFFLKSTQP
jgi:hypothetical protein